MIGAPGAGEAYLFDTSGTLLHTFTNPGVALEFGGSVAAVGTAALVAASNFGVAGGAGAVYMFDADPSSGTFGALLHTFTSGLTDDAFGTRIAVGGTELLVGAPQDDTSAADSGKTYVLDADLTSGTFGGVLLTLANPSPGVDDRFGGSVAFLGPDVLAGSHADDTSGADSGEAYLFDRGTGLLLQTFSNPTPAASDVFGLNVAAAGSNVLIGADDDTAAADAGAAYLFDTSGALLNTFLEPTPAATHLFGAGTGKVLGAVGPNPLIGAHHWDSSTTPGAAYLFDPSGTLLSSFARPTPMGGDAFGRAVVAIGAHVLVGAPRDDAGATDAGAAYLFTNVSCGNGTVEVGEGCDDGNTTGGDGCDASCQVEPVTTTTTSTTSTTTTVPPHETTKKATVLKAQLGTAYTDCGLPGDGFSTDPPGLLLPACTPQRGDAVCNFQPGSGTGKVLAKVAKNATTGLKDDLFIKASLAKLSSGCVNETLTLHATANATAADCSAAGSCTVVTAVIGNFAVGSCTVDTKGKCRIVTTVNAFAGDTVIEPGNRLQLEIRDLRMRRGTLTTFSPALFVD